LRLQSMEINSFRNIDSLSWQPGKRLNILGGSNGQGKTNILEAIFFACVGKSFRSMRDQETIRWEREYALLKGLFITDEREMELVLMQTMGSKKIKVNGSQIKGYPLGWPGVVLFTPEDLGIIKGSPQGRRDFFDQEIGPVNNQYRYYLGNYQRVVQQRNNLLKDIREGQEKKDSLTVWDEQLIAYGVKIIKSRLELLNKVSNKVRRIYRELTKGAEEITLRYGSSLDIDAAMSEEEIAGKFGKALASAQREEVARGQSVIGPHRDDIIFFINGKEIRLYGSQGQHRSLILSLKLTMAQIWYNEIGEYPILLLDDVMSELDAGRQEALLERVLGYGQTFITSSVFSDIETKPGIEKNNFIVQNGTIIN